MDRCQLEQMVNSFGSLKLFQTGTQKGLGHTTNTALGCQKQGQSLAKSLNAGVQSEPFAPRVFVVLTTLKIFFKCFVFGSLVMMCPSVIFFVF